MMSRSLFIVPSNVFVVLVYWYVIGKYCQIFDLLSSFLRRGLVKLRLFLSELLGGVPY